MYEELNRVEREFATAPEHRYEARTYSGPERRNDWRQPATPRKRRENFIGAARPEEKRASASLLSLMLDEVDYGMLLLSQSGEVMHVNHAARQQLDAHHPLQLVGGKLRARSFDIERVLRKALDAAAQAHRRCLTALGEREHQVMVAVVPIGSNTLLRAVTPTGWTENEAAILVVLGRRDVCQALSVQWFAQQHQLTSAESRVLTGLCNGSDPDEVAAEQGVALSTVRTQIGGIRAKTGATSLRELVRQVAVLPPLLSVLR